MHGDVTLSAWQHQGGPFGAWQSRPVERRDDVRTEDAFRERQPQPWQPHSAPNVERQVPEEVTKRQ